VNPKTTGILFLVAAALAAFVYFYEIRGEEGRREAEEAEKRLFANFEADDVEALALTTSDGASVRAERREGGWEIVAPLVFPGDDFAFDAMAAALARIVGETAIEDPQEASVYGLDADEREVRFSASGEERALRIGVYSVPTYGVNSFAKAFDDLRDKRVLDFDREAVKRIEASWPDGRVVLERGDAGWTVVQPVEGPADEEAVDGLLSDLSFLRASGFADDPPPDEETGLDRPAFAVRLSGPASGEGGEALDAALAIGSRSDERSRLARAARTTLYRIFEDRLEDFPTAVAAYRDRQLAAFEESDAKRLDILFHSAGGESVTIRTLRVRLDVMAGVLRSGQGRGPARRAREPAGARHRGRVDGARRARGRRAGARQCDLQRRRRGARGGRGGRSATARRDPPRNPPQQRRHLRAAGGRRHGVRARLRARRVPARQLRGFREPLPLEGGGRRAGSGGRGVARLSAVRTRRAARAATASASGPRTLRAAAG